MYTYYYMLTTLSINAYSEIIKLIPLPFCSVKFALPCIIFFIYLNNILCVIFLFTSN